MDHIHQHHHAHAQHHQSRRETGLRSNLLPSRTTIIEKSRVLVARAACTNDTDDGCRKPTQTPTTVIIVAVVYVALCPCFDPANGSQCTCRGYAICSTLSPPKERKEVEGRRRQGQLWVGRFWHAGLRRTKQEGQSWTGDEVGRHRENFTWERTVD
jgi:hypothetical protein